MGPGWRSYRETGGWDAGAASKDERHWGIDRWSVRLGEGGAKQRARGEGWSFGATPLTGRMSGFTYSKVKPVDTKHNLCLESCFPPVWGDFSILVAITANLLPKCS